MGSIFLYYLNDTCACVIRVCLRRSDIAQKLDIMELSFQVKHHTRPPDFLSFFSGNNGATKIKKMAQALNGTKYFLPFYCWKRPFKSNAHGNVFNRTSKTTLKPPWQMDFSHVWLKTRNLALAGRQPMQFVIISIFIFS